MPFREACEGTDKARAVRMSNRLGGSYPGNGRVSRCVLSVQAPRQKLRVDSILRGEKFKQEREGHEGVSQLPSKRRASMQLIKRGWN